MQTFLSQVVADIKLYDLLELKNHCFVFPSRRAVVHFRKELSKRFPDKPFWEPQLYSISDFVQHISKKSVLDAISLNFELYLVYKKYEPNTSFDSFYQWGQIILRDFDEVDKYMADAEKLFDHVKDYKEIDANFELLQEELEALRSFWTAFAQASDGEIKENFIKVWEVLYPIYKEFRANLMAKDAAYEGMLYRYLMEEKKADAKDHIHIDFKHISFVGFNALSKSEGMLIHYFIQNHQAKVYWDADHYYLNNPLQEAGKFVRRYKNHKWNKSENHYWLINDLREGEKNIHITGIPLKVGQAKYVGQEIQRLIDQGDFNPQDTAIVFGDESLLFPMLYALPPSIDAVNVTMGYPLKDSPIYKLLDNIIELQRNQRITDEGKVFYHRDVRNLLSNPYLRPFADEKIAKFIQSIDDKNWIFIPPHELLEEFGIIEGSKESPFKMIFEPIDSHPILIEQFINLLAILYDNYQKTDQEERERRREEKEKEASENAQAVEREFIHHLAKNLRRLQEIIVDYEALLDLDTFWSLLKEVIQSIRMPFSGEPLVGMQLMGFLETRTLDFKNLYILSVNEGAMPKQQKNVTYIPFNLRKAFGLPTNTEQDAIFAYHFYRLLQRAENIHLIYNTEVEDALSSQEVSRFIFQIREEMQAYAPNINFYEKVVTTAVGKDNTSPEITIEKNADILEKLKQYDKNSSAYKRPISPTALSTYINCSLQFYFKYVAKLRETNELEETMDARIFGDVLHKSIELLYASYLGKVVNEENIQNLKSPATIETVLKQALLEANFHHTEKGKNYLLKRILHQLVDKILEQDMKETPFLIAGLEAKEYSSDFVLEKDQRISVSGIIDRIDQIDIDNTSDFYVRIIDYKTGFVKLNTGFHKKSIQQYFDEYFEDPTLKVGFQAYVYSFIYWQEYPDRPIKAGIYPLKQINQGVLYLRKGELLDEEKLGYFGERLQKLLTEIYNPEIPFTQAEDEKRCLYCPFTDICKR